LYNPLTTFDLKLAAIAASFNAGFDPKFNNQFWFRFDSLLPHYSVRKMTGLLRPPIECQKQLSFAIYVHSLLAFASDMAYILNN
jgi:hypothetical protein